LPTRWEGNGEPVAICFSSAQRGFRRQRTGCSSSRIFPASGKRVAVIGAGVAGLTAARELALSGTA